MQGLKMGAKDSNATVGSVAKLQCEECLEDGVKYVKSITEALKEKKNKVYHVGNMYVVTIFKKTKMIPFFRTKEEAFSKTIVDKAKKNEFAVVTNGNWYHTNNWLAKASYYKGTAVISASDIGQEGQSILNGKVIGGEASPDSYFLKEKNGVYSTGGYGKVTHSDDGIGGLMPIIINGLPYDSENEYAKGASEDAKITGSPKSKNRKFLLKRSSAKYKAMENLNVRTGKTIWGYSSSQDCLIILVTPNGSQQMNYDSIRDELIKNSFDHAVGLDGSTSSLLYVNGRFLVRANERKDNSNTMGVGIKCL